MQVSNLKKINYPTSLVANMAIAKASLKAGGFVKKALANKVFEQKIYKGFAIHPPTMMKILYERISEMPKEAIAKFFKNMSGFFDENSGSAEFLKRFLTDGAILDDVNKNNRAAFDHYKRSLSILAMKNGFDVKAFFK